MTFNVEKNGPKSIEMSELSSDNRQSFEMWRGRTITVAKNEYFASCAGMWSIACLVTTLSLLWCIPTCTGSSFPMVYSIGCGMATSCCLGSFVPFSWGNGQKDELFCNIDRHYSRRTLNMAKVRSRRDITKRVLNLSLPSEDLKSYVKYGLISQDTYEIYSLLVQKRENLSNQIKVNETSILENNNKIKLSYDASHTNIQLFINKIPFEKQDDFIRTPEYQEFAEIKLKLERSKIDLEEKEKKLKIEVNNFIEKLHKELDPIDYFNEDLDFSCSSIFCYSYPYSSPVTYSECCSYCCSDEYCCEDVNLKSKRSG